MRIEAVELTGRWVGLEPLADSHAEGLREAAADPGIWTYMAIDAATDFEVWLERARAASAAGQEAHFVVRQLASKVVVGSSRYLHIVPEHKRLEIGHTWYAPRVQATQVNPECKLLLMTHAFETLGMNRVEFRCDARNLRSRAALRKLGAVEEGVLRKHMIVQHGFVRDTVQFAVTAGDWPEVRAGLLARLAG